MAQIERIYWIDSQIRANRYPNAQKVSERFELSERIAYKDRNFLKDRLHAPLRNDKSRGGWFYSDPTFVLPYLALSETESITLRRALLVATEYLGPLDSEPLLEIASKLGDYLPMRTDQTDESVRGAIRLLARLSPELTADLDRALSRRNRVEIQYYNPRRDTLDERVIQPYKLLVWRGEPYLIAYCEWRKEIRTFFLGRIRNWKLLPGESAFVRNPEFDVNGYLEHGLNLMHGEAGVTVRIRFSEYQARWVRERQYHSSQQIEELPGGGLILQMRVAGTEEVRRWLLGYGGEAEVLKPDSLREEMREELKKMQKIYLP